jgi:hypothetical protein
MSLACATVGSHCGATFCTVGGSGMDSRHAAATCSFVPAIDVPPPYNGCCAPVCDDPVGLLQVIPCAQSSQTEQPVVGTLHAEQAGYGSTATWFLHQPLSLCVSIDTYAGCEHTFCAVLLPSCSEPICSSFGSPELFDAVSAFGLPSTLTMASGRGSGRG